MTVNEAINQIIEAEDNLKTGRFGDICQLKAFGVARIGAADQIIFSGTMKDLLHIDFGKPLHSLVICAKKLHCIELEMYEHFIHNS